MPALSLNHSFPVKGICRFKLISERSSLVERVLRPWCDTIQLNVAQAIEIHPGALAQLPHRDQDMWPDAAGSHEYLINVIWPLTPFTHDNGATMVWPDSHGRNALAPTASREPVAATSEPGDTLIFLGSTLQSPEDRTKRQILISSTDTICESHSVD